ncbi:hypothetical protein C474_19804 [Halogeometricum pallidum JCM 14848]|uniref:Uncharacterized protein n=1 Tax=Halogeometricum pallidum JCM 14848 TaxID=1227487 RepID=M0CVI7_HALPD|nr:hypothetical protein [Halogeometricum pallidum]ELZ26427.1 hypothetical protein C474_19804 [Halogeometricum pallidum JCM 14848]
MSQTDDTADDERTTGPAESVHRDYILGVRIVERTAGTDGTVYRFEAPHHEGIEFDDADTATLYADVYFDVNGFQEAGTGERGVPPEIIQAGRDTLVAYFLTQPLVDVEWVASYYGEKPEKVQRYVNRVRKRAKKIREGAAEQGMT